MAWIESHQKLARHPKTRKLARILGVSIPTVIGHLHLLWWWAMDYASEGTLERYDASDIADAAMWEGDPVQFLDALHTAGFIDKDVNGVFSIHDWHDYVGRLLEKRRADAERKRSMRHRPADVQPISSGCLEDGAGNLTTPNLTQHNQTNQTNRLNPRAADNAAAQGFNYYREPAPVETEPPHLEPPNSQQNKPKDKPKLPFTSKKQEQLFDQFWQLYPRKKNKGQAERVWAKLLPSDELVAAILDGLERAKAGHDWQKEGGKYIPHPATWLNAKGWEDELGPPSPSQVPRGWHGLREWAEKEGVYFEHEQT